MRPARTESAHVSYCPHCIACDQRASTSRLEDGTDPKVIGLIDMITEWSWLAGFRGFPVGDPTMRVSRVMLVVSATAIGVMACKTDSSTAIAALDRVALIAVSLTSNRLTIGQSVPASVTLKNGSGTALSGKRVAWASANSAVAAVNSSS